MTEHPEYFWPPPFSTGAYRNEEPPPEKQRDKDISLSQFILSLVKGVGQLLPGDFANVLLAAGESCCQKVPHRLSGSDQDERTWVTVGLDERRLS